MSVYNSAEWVDSAVVSVLKQSFEDFEFLIYDDASTDSSLSKINTLAKSDSRIKVISNTQNKGLAESLNFLATKAKGEYIARMDADDISLPQRFAKQVEFLDNNPEIFACGTSFSILGSDIITPMQAGKNDLAAKIIFMPPMAHPTVMMRREKFLSIGGYPNLRRKQDYGLWVNAYIKGECFSNLPDVLLEYRRPLQANVQESGLDMLEPSYAKILKFYLGKNVTSSQITKHIALAKRNKWMPLGVSLWTLILLVNANNIKQIKAIVRIYVGYFAYFIKLKACK